MSRARLNTPPDWVMLGVPSAQGVAIYASKNLTEAEVVVAIEELEGPPDNGWRTFYAGEQTMTLTALGKDLVRAWGATYPEALARLLAMWTPERPARGTLVAGPAALESG